MKKKTKSGTKKVHFSYEERVKIEAYRNDGLGVRAIARKIERPRSSVSDEIRRNTVAGEYRAEKAKMKTYQRYWRARHQHLKVAMHDGLRRFVKEKLKRFWSPEGIAGRLTHVEKDLPSLGKDAVYAYVGSVYGGPLERYLWYRGKKKKSHVPRSNLKDRRFIEKRPKSVGLRRFFGDWEADFIVSGKRGNRRTPRLRRTQESIRHHREAFGSQGGHDQLRVGEARGLPAPRADAHDRQRCLLPPPSGDVRDLGSARSSFATRIIRGRRDKSKR